MANANTVIIQGYTFQGPWGIETTFIDVPGVYVIYTNQHWLDVGETDKLGQRINGNNHKRKPDWIRNAQSYPIWLAFLGISSPEERRRIESQLRLALNPLCGDR